MQWDMRHFDTQLLLTAAITPDVQQELLYRTNGELRFTEMYLQRLVWPILGQDFNLHLELARIGSLHFILVGSPND
jgi:hypothetical protein